MEKKEFTSGKVHNVASKIKGNRRCYQNNVVEMKGPDLKYCYFQKHGFQNPILIKEKSGLGLRVPSQTFMRHDLKKLVGSKRNVRVVNGKGEKVEMMLRDFMKCLDAKKEDICALERFNLSGSKLDAYLDQPYVVQQLDWSNFLGSALSKESSPVEENCNAAVQRFCMMTLATYFDDFKLSAGECSQWIHLLHGKITLWLVNPSDDSYALFREWKMGGEKTFFGEDVTTCQRLKMDAGWTLLVPSGWIVAQYTMEDALIFGGNFLNSFCMQNQIKAYKMLDSLSNSEINLDGVVHCRHFKETLWCILDSHVASFLGHSRLQRSSGEVNSGNLGRFQSDEHEKVISSSNEDTDVEDSLPETESRTVMSKSKETSAQHPSSSKATLSSPSTSSSSPSSLVSPSVIKMVTVKLENCLLVPKQSKTDARVSLTNFESDGLKCIVEFLLAEGFADLPPDLSDPNDIISDVERILQEHNVNEVDVSITGKPVMTLCAREKSSSPSKSLSGPSIPSNQCRKIAEGLAGTHIPSVWGRESVAKRQRVRCSECEPCTRGKCGGCQSCREVRKFGGQGEIRQRCINKQCLAPNLSMSAVCSICGKGNLQSSEFSSGQVQHQTAGELSRSGDFVSHKDTMPDLIPGKIPEIISNKMDIKNDNQKNGKLSWNSSNSLLECSICWKVTHSFCFKLKHPELCRAEVTINDDLPNSWDCPVCCEARRLGHKKYDKSSTVVRVPSTSSSASLLKTKGESYLEPERVNEGHPAEVSITCSAAKEIPLKKIKSQVQLESADVRKRHRNDSASFKDGVEDKKLKISSEEKFCNPIETSSATSVHESSQPPCPKWPQMSSSFVEASSPSTPLRLGPHCPLYTVRPIPSSSPPKFLPVGDGSRNHPLRMEHWLRIFGFLMVWDLSHCMLVCKTWNCWCYYTPLWKKMDLSKKTIRKVHLIAIAKHQPQELDLSHTNINKEQLAWLSGRVFRLRKLKLEACSWSTISCFSSSILCPVLTHLDLSWVSRFNDSCLKSLLSAPANIRPGMTGTGCRLSKCVELRLAGTEIGNSSVELISKVLTGLKLLDLSYCIEINFKSLEFLAGGVPHTTPHPGKHLLQQSPGKHLLQQSSGKQHHPKYSLPTSILAIPSPHHHLLAMDQPHCNQSTSSSLSSASSPHSLNNTQELTSPNSIANSTTSIVCQPSLHPVLNHEALPLPQLQKLYLVGCLLIKDVNIASLTDARPYLEIFSLTEK